MSLQGILRGFHHTRPSVLRRVSINTFALCTLFLVGPAFGQQDTTSVPGNDPRVAGVATVAQSVSDRQAASSSQPDQTQSSVPDALPHPGTFLRGQTH